jgi:hypothetical protein
MTEGTHQECLELAKQALQCLQNRDIGDVTRAIRKLQLCAHLLNDENLKRWCAFHLGEYDYRLPRLKKNSNEYERCKYMDILIKEIEKKGIDASLEEIISKVGNSGEKLINIDFMENKYGQLIKEKNGNDGTYYRDNLLDAIVICANAAINRATKFCNLLIEESSKLAAIRIKLI